MPKPKTPIMDFTTWSQVEGHLLEVMDQADSKPSKSNPSLTREQTWNMYLRQCLKNKGKDISIRIRSIFLKSLKKSFPNE